MNNENKQGLVVNPLYMAKAIIDGEKTLLVKPIDYDLEYKKFALIGGGKVLGNIDIGGKIELTRPIFAEHEQEHLITKKILEDWATVQSSWNSDIFYAWVINSVEKFDEPIELDCEVGADLIVEKVVTAYSAFKIDDPKTYKPENMTDAQLRDDFRIVLAWYSTYKKDPEGFKYDLETLTVLLRKIIKELVRRGPEVIRFDPENMARSVRSFFAEIADEVKVPEIMFKEFDLKPDSDVESMTTADLVRAHNILHDLYEREALSQTSVPGWSIEDIVNLHARILDAFERRGGDKHLLLPPMSQLDEISEEFETMKVAKSEYATVQHSGVKIGPPIKIDEVLPNLKTFKLRSPYIYLVGGLANHGETEGDIDILINDNEFMSDWMRDIIHFRVGRCLPGEVAERLQIHCDRDRGPFTNHVELYDLCLVRRDSAEIKEMRDEVVRKAISDRLAAQAEKAKKEDKLTLGEFFYQPKPTRAAGVNQLQSVNALVSMYRENEDQWLPAVVQKKYDGANHQVHVSDSKVLIYSEDGENVTHRLPKIAEELRALNSKRFIAVMEVEKWVDGKHYPRETVAAYLHSKEPADDSDLIANIYDVLLYDDKDIHSLPTAERLKYLRRLGVKQHTDDVPNLKYRLNEAVGLEVNSLNQLERATQSIRKKPGSEGIVAKQSDANYPLQHETKDKWIKFHNATSLFGIVYDRKKTAGGAYVYQYGVLPGREKPLESIEIDGRVIVPVGDTFATAETYNNGDHVLLEAETINYEMHPNGIRLSAWVPRIIGEHSGKADNVDAVVRRAKNNLVLQEKVIDEQGEVTYKSAFCLIEQVEKKTTAELLVECGPPHFWSGSIAACLGHAGRAKINALWGKLKPHEKKKVGEAFEKMFEATELAFQLEDEYGDIAKCLIEKQQDPYLQIPPEDKKYRYSVQHHYRGRGFHADLRIENKPKELLIGWTMNTQIKGATKDPVTTLAEAKSLDSNMDKISKVNWNTGEWASRPKAGTDKLVRTEILSERKAPEPYAWIDVEGKTKDPEPGKAPPVGGTRQYPGVFHIVDQGTVEYGAQKPWFHEYFFHGDGLNYRMFFRLLDVSKSSEDKNCESCDSDKDILRIGFADSRDVVHLCSKCGVEFLKKQGVVLPPSEEQMVPDKASWLAIYPDDQMPYAITKDAVDKNWMPPSGFSALPSAVRSQIPEQYRYWKKGAKAKAIRDELVEKIKSDEIKIDLERVYKSEKASLLDADFVLQEQTWRGPIQVRFGPSRSRWMVRLNTGQPQLTVFELQLNPLYNDKIAALVEKDRHKESMNVSGDIKPGHYLNPTKDTPSHIAVLDKGKASITLMSDEFIKIYFKGKTLKGVYTLKSNNSEYLWEKSQEAPKVEKELQEDFNIFIPVDTLEVKKMLDGEEKRLVTGIVLEPNVVDAQNDYIKPEAIESAAHDFLRNYNNGTEIGLMHKMFGDIGIELVESFIAPFDFLLNRKNVKKGSWVVTVHVSDDNRWKDVKEGRLTGFSIGGLATYKVDNE